MYTEHDIKCWFLYLIQKYQNCPFSETLKMVQDTMFDKNWREEKDTLDYFINYIKKEG